MKAKKAKSINGCFIKECAFCCKPFFAKTDRAKYCSDSHKVQFSQMVKKSHQWYNIDPNEGKIVLPGTVTSWEMPEEKLVFTGNLIQLNSELAKYMSREQLTVEKEYIENRKPFSETKEWIKSATQIFTEENFMEVFRILPIEYKLYVWPWGEDNEKPFIK
jgi:hypothetical protein